MHKLDHPNILKLLGVCLDGGPAPYIVMPFMVNGSLKAHLEKERNKLVLKAESSQLEDIVSPSLIAVCGAF